MARYDKDNDINTPNNQKNIDKPKGEMSVREAASMEMEGVHTETGMRGAPVHGFGDGQADTPKRHTGTTRPRTLVHSDTSERAELPLQGSTDLKRAEVPMQGSEPQRMEIPMQGSTQVSAGESVTDLVERIFQLPFHAQLGMLRMVAPRILGAMDARDQEVFMRDLRSEIGTVETGEAADLGTQAMDTPDIQGT